MIEVAGYRRVSTEDQKRTGFGLKAQENTILGHCSHNKLKLVRMFTEIASGLDNDRPIVLEAIDFCKAFNITLVVAKQSRLSRRVSFVSRLTDIKFPFFSVESPHANDFQKHVQAAVDQNEVMQLRDNTIKALKVAKAKGVRLGANVKKLKRTLRIKKNAYLKKVRGTFLREKEKYKTLKATAERLNRMRLKKLNGKKGGWTVSEVFSILQILLKKKNTKTK